MTAPTLLLCAALSVVLPRGPAPQDPVELGPETPFHALDFEAASALAVEEGLMLVVALVEPESEACRKLRAGAWSDDGVARWLEVEAVAIEVDAASRADLVEIYSVKETPTVLFLEGDGIELDRLRGVFRPRRFVKAIKGALGLREFLADLRPRMAENPEDPVPYFQLARAYVSVERLEPAVEAFDAAWTIGRGVPLFEPIRTGQMLNEIGLLTDNFPPAKKAVIRWRRAAMAQLEDPTGPGAVQAAKEVSALNRQARDEMASVTLYERMRANPEVPAEVLAALFNGQVVSVYYGRGRFEELLEGFGDVFVRTDEHFGELELWRDKERQGTIPPGEEPMIGTLENGLYFKTGMYLETLLNLGREDEARQLLDLVLLREPRAMAYRNMVVAARKQGHGALAKEIVERGLATLQKKELSEFKVLAERFLPERGH